MPRYQYSVHTSFISTKNLKFYQIKIKVIMLISKVHFKSTSFGFKTDFYHIKNEICFSLSGLPIFLTAFQRKLRKLWKLFFSNLKLLIFH